MAVYGCDAAPLVTHDRRIYAAQMEPIKRRAASPAVQILPGPPPPPRAALPSRSSRGIGASSYAPLLDNAPARPAPSRFPIRFGAVYRWLSVAIGVRPAQCYVTVGNTVEVRMGSAFHARFPRTSVRAVSHERRTTLNRGVHGRGGRWLVNGSGDRILNIELEPAVRARVLGAVVQMRTLRVSVDDPEALAASLSR